MHILYVKKEQLQNKLGQRIIDLRTQRGWSHSDLGSAGNKDRQAIEKIENGKVNATAFSLYKIARALQIAFSELVNI
jgi:putative transcriptional regulator